VEVVEVVEAVLGLGLFGCEEGVIYYLGVKGGGEINETNEAKE
jgi:hypothetical protein